MMFRICVWERPLYWLRRSGGKTRHVGRRRRGAVEVFEIIPRGVPGAGVGLTRCVRIGGAVVVEAVGALYIGAPYVLAGCGYGQPVPEAGLPALPVGAGGGFIIVILVCPVDGHDTRVRGGEYDGRCAVVPGRGEKYDVRRQGGVQRGIQDGGVERDAPAHADHARAVGHRIIDPKGEVRIREVFDGDRQDLAGSGDAGNALAVVDDGRRDPRATSAVPQVGSGEGRRARRHHGAAVHALADELQVGVREVATAVEDGDDDPRITRGHVPGGRRVD